MSGNPRKLHSEAQRRAGIVKSFAVLTVSCVLLLVHLINRSSTGYGSTDKLPVPDITNDIVAPENGDGFPVHIVRFYKGHPNANSNGFCWTECLSILSVILYVRPSTIYIHTNYPDFWPFDRCYMVTNYSMVRFVHARQKLTMNGKRIETAQHEADIIKYSAVYQYGGLSTDTDVFYLPGVMRLIKDWRNGRYECLLSQEDYQNISYMNSGFIACRKGHPYIRDVLQAYQQDYRPEWTYNSGRLPWDIYMKSTAYQSSIYLDTIMSNHTTTHRSPIRYKKIAAWHSYYHECRDTFSNTLTRAVNSSLWEMLHFIHAQRWNVSLSCATDKTLSYC